MQMQMKKRLFSFGVLLLSFSVFAQQTVGGQADHVGLLDKSLSEISGATPYLSNQEAKQDFSVDSEAESSSYILGSGANYIEKKAHRPSLIGSTSQPPIGSIPRSDHILEYKASDLFKKIYHKGSSAVSLAYYRMNYQVSNSTYKSIFNKDNSRDLGGLFVHYDRYLWRPRLTQVGYTLGLGAHYQSGKGTFLSGSRSSTEFKLWTIPMDAHLSIGLPISSFATIAASAGPAAMIILQNRSDYEDGEAGKNVNQISYGYSARGQFKISMANLMRKNGAELYRAQSISNYFMNLEARYDRFEHFQQDDISISGASFGLGFTFDFI